MRLTRLASLLILTGLAFSRAYSEDVSSLRAGGQRAVDELHAQWTAASASDRAELAARLDAVCGQKDCAASRLFWYTELDEARAAALRLGRPVLALHLLGGLDEELSCANSRFFRTLLYSDQSISAVLRDDYVLFWHSVRPVPRVTIEMGDGRVIRQTITGNSVHYLLDAEGRVLDALPGLYSPAAFRQQLESWRELHDLIARTERDARQQVLRNYHEARLSALRRRFEELGAPVELVGGAPERRLTAIDAMPLAMTKSVTETRVLARLAVPPAPAPVLPVSWLALGEQRMGEVVFAPEALELIRRKHFGSGSADDAQFLTLIDGLRRTVATDTIVNEARMHSSIHQWFADGEVQDLTALNGRIYDELFLTPGHDPWLGLQQPDVFMAIERTEAGQYAPSGR